MLSFSLSDIVFTVINVIILYFILRKFLFHPVTNMIEKRQAEIDDNLKEAAETKQVAEETLSAYKTQLSQVESEAAELLIKAKEKAKIQSNAILEKAHTDAQKLTIQTEAQLSRERDELYAELQNEVIDLAMRSAKTIVEPESKDKNEDFFASFTKQAGDLT